jgi:hypothetical protein
MKKKIYTITLLLILINTSCNQVGMDGNHSGQAINNKLELSLEEYISIAYDKPKEVGDDKIKSIINKFIGIQISRKTKGNNNYSIEIQEKQYIDLKQNSLRTKSSDIDSEETHLIRIPVLKVKISDGSKNGLVYISSDERFPDILAYIPSVNPDTLSMDDKSGQDLLLRQAEDVLIYKARVYNKIRNSLRTVTIEKVSDQLCTGSNAFSFDKIKDLIEIKDINAGTATKSIINSDPANGQTLLSQIGPYLFTQWSQSKPYNNNMGGSCTDWFGDPTNYKVSASIVATAQLLAFFEPSINANGTQVNWSYLMEKPEIVEPDYFNSGDPAAKRNMIASLMKFCSDKCAVSYTCSGSSYYMSNIVNFWKSYGIKTDGVKNFDYNIIKTSLDNVKLTYCQGKTSNNEGHSWLIDGYMVVSPTGAVSNTNSYVHANMGMGNYYNGYYLVNSNTGMTFDSGFANFTKDIVMYTNISQ